MFGPLNFVEQKAAQLSDEAADCPLCSTKYDLTKQLDVFMKHLFEAHDLVIEDMQKIPKLVHYLDYWHNKFQTSELSSIVPSLDIEIHDEVDIKMMKKKKYFLLSTLTKEDKDLRQLLRLEDAMERQEFERTDTNYTQDCLFCRLEFKGLRKDFLEHLSIQHNLQLGNPQNLVFVDELIQYVKFKLDTFCCIYCEKVFPDRAILKEHMRKKIHKRINRHNKNYDKYFIVNYTGNDDEEEAIPEVGERRNSDSEYFDWTESDTMINCLFCDTSEADINNLCMHMQCAHRFNFPQLVAHLDFYQRVKLVNFLRKEVHLKRCPNCQSQFSETEELRDHMRDNSCYVIPDITKFEQPEYYFPTYENDAFLYYLEDVED